MNPVDPKITAVFQPLLKGSIRRSKWLEVDRCYADARRRILDEQLGAGLDHLFKICSRDSGVPADPDKLTAINLLTLLRAGAFQELPSLLLKSWRSFAKQISLEELLSVAPDSNSIEVWRKANKVSVAKLASTLSNEPLGTEKSAGADWLIMYAKPNQTGGVMKDFLGKCERHPQLLIWSKSVAAALAKDKKGGLIDWVLRQAWCSESEIDALSAAITSDWLTQKVSVLSIPETASKRDCPDRLRALVSAIFRDVSMTEGKQRDRWTALTASLGAGVALLERRGPICDEILGVINEIAVELRNTTRAPELSVQTWIFENLGASLDASNTDLELTAQGARHVMTALENLASGHDAAASVQAMANNLGMRKYGTTGENLTFDPGLHEDLDSGLLRGDPARVETPGWKFDSRVILRAKVRKA